MVAEWGAMRAVGMAGAALRVKWPWGRKVSSPWAQPHSRPPGPLPRAPEAEQRRPTLGLLLGHPGLGGGGHLNSAAPSTLPGPWGPTPQGQSLQASLEAPRSRPGVGWPQTQGPMDGVLGETERVSSVACCALANQRGGRGLGCTRRASTYAVSLP